MVFYLKFWGVLGVDLVEVLNFCHQAGFLAKSQREGLITLTFKRGDRFDPRNWRPITLLSSLLVVFAVLNLAFACVASFFGVFRTQITWSSGNRRFYAKCIFFPAISVFLPLIISFL